MSENFEVHELIYKYILDYDKKGEEILKNIFGKILRKPEFDTLRTSSDYFDDLYYEFYDKKVLSQREVYTDKFQNNKKGLIAFLQKVIYNFLQDQRDKKVLKAEPMTVIKNNEEKIELSDLIENPNNIDIIKIIEAKEILNHLNEFFNQEDKKTLCYIFFRDKFEKDYCIKNVKPDTIYKRVERMKKDKLPKFIEAYNITFDSFVIFKDNIMLSEVCKKICL